MNIAISAPLSKEYLKELKDRFSEVTFHTFRAKNVKREPGLLENSEVYVTYGFELNSAVLAGAKNLKWVQIFRAGFDDLPLDEIRKRGIILTNVRGIHKIPMSEYTMGMILMLAHRFLEYRQNQLNNNWDRSIQAEELFEKTLGVVGTGSIGAEICRRAKAFGMHTIGINTRGTLVDGVDEVLPPQSLHELLSASDYVVVTVPLNDGTRGMIGRAEFEAMKPTACFVNISRGEVVDEEALIEALRGRRIKAAVLDVFQKEPLPPESELWKLDNVIITPHISALSPRYTERAFEVFTRNLDAYINGRELFNKVE